MSNDNQGNRLEDQVLWCKRFDWLLTLPHLDIQVRMVTTADEPKKLEDFVAVPGILSKVVTISKRTGDQGRLQMRVATLTKRDGIVSVLFINKRTFGYSDLDRFIRTLQTATDVPSVTFPTFGGLQDHLNTPAGKKELFPHYDTQEDSVLIRPWQQNEQVQQRRLSFPHQVLTVRLSDITDQVDGYCSTDENTSGYPSMVEGCSYESKEDEPSIFSTKWGVIPADWIRWRFFDKLGYSVADFTDVVTVGSIEGIVKEAEVIRYKLRSLRPALSNRLFQELTPYIPDTKIVSLHWVIWTAFNLGITFEAAVATLEPKS